MERGEDKALARLRRSTIDFPWITAPRRSMQALLPGAEIVRMKKGVVIWVWIFTIACLIDVWSLGTSLSIALLRRYTLYEDELYAAAPIWRQEEARRCLVGYLDMAINQ